MAGRGLTDLVWLRSGDVARVLDMSGNQVRSWCDKGIFKTAKRGDTSTGYNGQWLIHRDEVIKFANERGRRNA